MFHLARILVPVDFSKYSEAALAQAIELAEQFKAELHLLHVVSENDSDALRQAAEHLERLVPTELMLRLKVARAVVYGLPGREIVRKALRECFDLIVMGTHGRTGLVRLAMGSIAERVLRTAPCPVMIVRHPDQAVDLLPEEEPLVESEYAPALDLIQRAATQRATDIHIDPAEGSNYQVRFRIDGHLQHYCHLDRDIAERLMQQLTVLANLDIADPFRPKEGRLRLPAAMPDVEARITTSPVSGGEAVAVRLFTRETGFHRLDQLGLSEHALAAVNSMLRRGEGIVLVTGPTGSGKTTTVYSMLETLLCEEQNIVSIEDPVEFPVAFVRQMEVDARHGITMASGLRTLLRMDPDVIFLGEIRDGETADIAMRAASSGKYVLSTLHTRDAAGTITALRDLHGDCRSLAANLTGIVSQRLVRRLCPHCRQPIATTDERQRLPEEIGALLPDTTFGAKGCEQCRGTGYHGRIGVFEAVVVENAVREAIVQGLPEGELRQVMRSCGTPSLTADAIVRVQEGITSVAEVLQMRWL